MQRNNANLSTYLIIMPIAGPADPGHGQGYQIREDCSRGGVHPFSYW